MGKIQGCSGMLQGSLVVLYRKCGKKGCRCERGEKHGPAYYLSYKEGGSDTDGVYFCLPVRRSKGSDGGFLQVLGAWGEAIALKSGANGAEGIVKTFMKSRE